MPGGPELAVAYVSISASTAGLGKQIVGATDVAAGRASKSFGQKFAAGAKRVLGTAAKATMIGAGVAAGSALVSGFKSATREQDFEATMKGLYKSGARAQATIEGVNKAASKSPLGYDAYQKTAETLAYMGIKGPNAIKSLKNMNAAIVASGGGSEQLERATHGWLTAINKGKVQMDSLNQISDAGIPIYDALAAHFGVTRKQLNKMVTEGKVGVDDLNQVMKDAPGKLWAKNQTAAAKATQTFGNQAKIAWNNISQSIGTALLPLLDKLTPMLSKAGDAVSGFIDGMSSGKGAGGKFAAVLKGIGSAFASGVKFAAKYKDIIGVLVAGLVTYKAVTLGVAAAQKIQTLWAKRAAVSQRILNIAMKNNPIGRVITLLTLLAAGLVYAYKHSKTFRKIVNGALHAVTAAFKATWKWIKTKFIPFFTETIPAAFRGVWDWTKKTFKGLWNGTKNILLSPVKLAWHAIKKQWSNIRGGFRAGWDWVKKTFRTLWNGAKAILRDPVSDAWDAIKKQWSNIKGGFRAGWDWVKKVFKKEWRGLKLILTDPIQAAKNVFRNLLGPKGTVRTIFSKAVDAIGRIWDGIRKAAAKPVNFIIRTVYNNGIRKALNLIPGVNLKAASPIKFDRGGTIRGRRAPYGDKVLTHLAPGEEVISNSRGQADRFRPLLKRINSMAGGGTVWPARGQRHRHTSGYPWATWSGDVNIPGSGDYGNPVRAYKDGTIAKVLRWSTSYGHHIVENLKGGGSALYAHLSKILVRAGEHVRAGQLIGRVGQTGNASGPHLHFEIRGTKASPFAGASAGGSGDFGFGAALSNAWDAVKKLPSKFGAWGSLFKGGMSEIWDKIKSYGKQMLSLTGGPAKVHGVPQGGGSAAKNINLGRRSAAQSPYNWTGAQWNALYDLWMKESGWRTRADNPYSSAYGIPQALPGSKMAEFGADWRTNPVTQIQWGLKYIQRRYGTPIAAWRHSKRLNWYANGITSASPGWAMVGERGPEMVKFRGGERVVPNEKIGRVDGGGGVTNNFYGDLYAVDPDEAARKIQRKQEIGVLQASLA